jgi:hypothetical protein
MENKARSLLEQKGPKDVAVLKYKGYMEDK